MKTDLLYEAQSYQILGACFEVYREKGCGFLELVYQECLQIELRLRGVPFIAQKPLALEYKGCPLQARYEPDFVCHEKIILELKAVTELADEHRGSSPKLPESNAAQARLTGELWSLSQGPMRAHCGRAGPIQCRAIEPRNTRNTRNGQSGEPLRETLAPIISHRRVSFAECNVDVDA